MKHNPKPTLVAGYSPSEQERTSVSTPIDQPQSSQLGEPFAASQPGSPVAAATPPASRPASGCGCDSSVKAMRRSSQAMFS